MSKMFNRSTILFIGLFAVTILVMVVTLLAATEPVAVVD
jgi:preprotein translocase subunit SecG